MTRIPELLHAGRTFSFEFFPPRTPEAEAALEQALVELEPLKPSFVSVTYGAGGSTREKTHDLVVRMLRDTTMLPMAHVTCVAHTRAELREILERYAANEVENIIALGGDTPVGSDLPHGELAYAIELVELAREVADFTVAVAAYPEGHPQSPDLEFDRTYLARKLAAADFGITQFFFRADDYFRMVDGLAERGVTKPVLPGVMPILSLASIDRMAQLSGAALPREVVERVEAVGEDPDDVRRVGIEIATELSEELLERGAPGLHFITMNRSTATREIFTNLRLHQP